MQSDIVLSKLILSFNDVVWLKVSSTPTYLNDSCSEVETTEVVLNPESQQYICIRILETYIVSVDHKLVTVWGQSKERHSPSWCRQILDHLIGELPTFIRKSLRCITRLQSEGVCTTLLHPDIGRVVKPSTAL